MTLYSTVDGCRGIVSILRSCSDAVEFTHARDEHVWGTIKSLRTSPLVAALMLDMSMVINMALVNLGATVELLVLMGGASSSQIISAFKLLAFMTRDKCHVIQLVTGIKNP